MEKAKFPIFVVIFAVLALSFNAPCWGKEVRGVVEKVGNFGHINWSEGFVYAKGMGIRKKNGDKTAGGSAEQGSEVYDSAGLFETVKGVRIDSSSIVGDLVQENAMIHDQLRAMVGNAQIVKREYLSDGTVEAVLAFDLRGGLGQLALPQDIKHVPEIKTIPNRQAEKETAERPRPADATTIYTGLVLDARGLHGMPAMAPRIFNESGEEVYGAAHVSREFAVQQGMAAFATNLESGQNNPRVSKNPITVRGLRTEGVSRCDFVITDADARRIRSASENLLFLKKCKVVIVLDSR